MTPKKQYKTKDAHASPKKEPFAKTVNDKLSPQKAPPQVCTGSQICLWGTPGHRTQSNHTQDFHLMHAKFMSCTQGLTGKKHIVCSYFSHHPIFPTFIKIIFKTVNASCIDNIVRKAFPVVYNTINEKMVAYCCLLFW